MAIQEHVDKLTSSVEVWNQWRRDHPNIEPDLFRAHLREADLREANVRRARLSRADQDKLKDHHHE
jgi:uncharacterized protein YjbI with pentapeptide repeats